MRFFCSSWNIFPSEVFVSHSKLPLETWISSRFLGSISPTYLQAAFTPVAPESIGIQSSCQCLFTLLGSTGAKAVCRTLMKLTPGLLHRQLKTPIRRSQRLTDPKWFIGLECCTRYVLNTVKLGYNELGYKIFSPKWSDYYIN